MTPNDFANIACRILNEALAVDPSATSAVVRPTQVCLNAMADHPHVIVSHVGFLGGTDPHSVALGPLGCATPSTVENEPRSAGMTRVFHAGQQKVVEAAKSAAIGSGMSIDRVSVDAQQEIIIAHRGASFEHGTSGDAVRILIEPATDGTAVRIVCDRSLSLNPAPAAEFTEKLFTDIGRGVGEYR